MKNDNTSPTLNSPVAIHVQHHDDVHVISSHMQDAVVQAEFFAHDPEQKTFKLMANRFCWEKFLNPTNPIKLRVHSGIHFNHVHRVSKRNMHTHHPEKLFNLLSIEATQTAVLIRFSENAEIKLDVEKICCRLADLHDPYPTQFAPSHD